VYLSKFDDDHLTCEMETPFDKVELAGHIRNIQRLKGFLQISRSSVAGEMAGKFYVVELEVTKPLKSNIGFVGAQKEVTAGLLRGGGTQVHFDEATKGQDRWNFSKPSSSPKLLN
jgi:hypothetical protein